jgi:hypothetical protein
MRSITVAIPDTAAAKLAAVARHRFRAPRQEAAALLVDAIDRAGLVTEADGAAAQSKNELCDVGTRER